MAFGTQDNTDEAMNEINMTPLVDVMLVLLMIFIVTAPIMKHSINIDQPRASNRQQVDMLDTVRLSVNTEGSYIVNNTKISDDGLAPRLQFEAVRYERVAQAMATA